MIILAFDNDSPFVKGVGQATRTASPQAASVEGVDAEFCYCGLDCEYIEPVFWHASGDTYKNDKRSFLFTKKRSSDTIAFELYKNGVKVADLTDDTYGILYNNFSVQPDYRGYLLDFLKVYNEQGAGQYVFKAQMNILGVDVEYESNKFDLMQFSTEAADGTVKIETYQSGNIIKSEFDFTDLLPDGWYQSVRLYGKFTDKDLTLEQDNYLNSDRVIEQIQDKGIIEYTLYTKPIPSSIYNMLFFQDILANRTLISDYNIINEEVFKQVDVIPQEVDKERISRKSIFTLKYKERIENNVKTNI